MTAAKILVVEDEAPMRLFLRTTLSHNDYDVLEASCGVEALDRVADAALVLLDLGLPDIDGVEVVAKIRDRLETPIIVISARHFEFEKIEALDRGANDYITKPFGAGELLARIRVAMRSRRMESVEATSLILLGELRIDLDNRLVTLGTEELHLTPTEHKLLVVLARRVGRVVSHRELLREVWGPESTEQIEYLRVYMRQLRYKIEPEPSQPRYLVTIPGLGYRLKVDK